MKRLAAGFLKNEDGVALAFGMTFFLLVFLLGMSVYAAGETVRQRMELQNAADAAAYSAAVVQADTLSRIACINKAMSWTYVMMNRRIMDYAVDKWLERVDQKWEQDFRMVQAWNMLSTCGTRNEGTDYWAGFSGANKQIFLNRSRLESIDSIRLQRNLAAAQGKSYHALAVQIEKDRRTLAAMRQAEEDLLSRMPDRIENAVRKAIGENISGTPNDDAAGGAGIAYTLLQNSPDTYMETMKNNREQEEIFLAFGGFEPDVTEISRSGVDKWWVRQGGGEGFRRHYQQSFSSLTAEWQWFGIKYVLVPDACVPVPRGVGFSSVNGAEARDGYFECGQPAEPYRLKKEFFGEKGTLLVGVKRKLNNPFSFLFADGSAKGLFYAFSVKDGRSMWAASAARAAYAPPERSKREGAYETTFLDVPARDTWNLCEPDWDAVFIPVALAFDSAQERKYRKAGKEPLAEVYSKLSPGSISAPPGMNGQDFRVKQAREALHH